MFAPTKSPSKIILCLFLYVIGSLNLFAQYRFDTWTTDNGLPQNGVRAIAQTPDGYLWFTTFDGLVRFDGVRFTTFDKTNTKGIINNRFTGLYGDKDGTLYATTMEDGILTIYKNGVFSSFNSAQVPGHYINRIEPSENGELRFLVEDEDRKSKSWYFLRNDKFEFNEKQTKFNEKIVVQGKAGTQWTISLDEVRELNNGKLTVYPIDLNDVKFKVNSFVDSAGNLWIGENRAHRLQNGIIETFTEKDGLPLNSIYHSFWEDLNGSVWFGSGGGPSTSVGLIEYKNNSLTFWGKDHGLQNTPIMDVFNDREGTTWLATNKGLSRLRKSIISGYSTKDGIIHSEVYPLYRDRRENIWIGTTKGLSIFRDGKFTPLMLKQKGQDLPANEMWRNERMSVQSLWEDPNGKMWIGLNGGIYISQNEEVEMLLPTKSHHVFAIKSDSFGNVWAATNKGLLQFNDYKLTHSYSAKDGLPNEFMTFVFEDSKNRLWFGGLGGLSEFKDGKFINYTINEGLTGNAVRSIYEDSEGILWIGTYDEGLSRFKDGKFVNYKAEQGLANNGVFAIQEDEKGYFWISSNRGIYRVKRQELNDFADGKISKINSVSYGKQDGMLSNECNGGRQPASIKDKDGKFWFPTQEGVVVVDSASEKFNSQPPSVVIEEVLVEREPIDIKNEIFIEPGEKNIEIRYTGISLIKPEQVKFQYKLEGHDSDWIDAGTRRTAYYSFLPPEIYTFHVRAANSDGVWNETGAKITLKLKPFFYQTKLFILLCLLVLAISLLIIWKVSVYQLEAKERKLTKLVAKKTEELREANEELQQLVNLDGLTKIGNRRRFETFLADEWHRARRFKTQISLIMIDIDHFKLFNDTYGHQAGDNCLQKVAEALAETIKRPTDLVARFGGEEFAIILGGTDLDGAVTIAEQAIENIKNLQIPHSKSLTNEYVTISLGIATTFANVDLSDIDLIKTADKALYQAKENGRNRIYSFDSFTQIAKNATVLDAEIIEVNS